MARPYSEDLRIRLVGMVDSGRAARAAGRLFNVSASSAVKWVQRWRREKSVAPSKKRGHRRSVLEPVAEWLLQLVKSEADLTLEEIRVRLAKRGIRASVSMIWNFYDRHNISFKKKPFTPANKTEKTWPPHAAAGGRCKARLIQNA